LVCTYYVIKWVEAKALYSLNEQFVVGFLFEDIFTCFGVPREIVTDQRTQFTSNLFKSITEQYRIKYRKSSPYHPQTNRQVESTNKVIEAILTKIVQLHHKDWVDWFLEALWAYITTRRTITDHTPYELVYGKHVLFPIEFQVKTFRSAMQLGMDLD
jgi:transposase InsO family protein